MKIVEQNAETETSVWQKHLKMFVVGYKIPQNVTFMQ